MAQGGPMSTLTTGVRLQSNGNYWQAAWQVPGRPRPMVKSIGSKDKYSKRAAMQECRKIQEKHFANPAMAKSGKAPTLAAWCAKYAEIRTDLGEETAAMHAVT